MWRVPPYRAECTLCGAACPPPTARAATSGTAMKRRSKGSLTSATIDAAEIIRRVRVFPLQKGRVTKQAHVGLPEGTFEEEHGREAFDGRASHLYRTHPPTAWVRIDGPLQPHAYDLNGLKTADLTDAGAEWQPILHNDDVSIFVSRRSEPMSYFLRDSDGDVCYFVHRGSGLLETDYE